MSHTIRKTEAYVNERRRLPHPQIFFARDRGKSLPRLHKALVEANRTKAIGILRPTLPFQLMEPNSEAVGPMEPLQGPTPVAAQMAPIKKLAVGKVKTAGIFPEAAATARGENSDCGQVKCDILTT